MDIQIADEDGQFATIMQHYELEMVLDYAEKWSEISNQSKNNNLVKATIFNIRKCITMWESDHHLIKKKD